MNIIPAIGERALLVGQTGSGKSVFGCWLLTYLPIAIIYDTKIEPKFESLPGSVVVENWNDIHKAFEDRKEPARFVIFRPPVEVTLDPDLLDTFLQAHYQSMRGVPAFIDEGYQFCNQGRSGPGFTAMLTRGRSRGITTITASQRPVWLTRFAITESQRFYIFRLADERDRKTLESVIPFYSSADIPAKYHCFYYDFDLEAPMLLKPIPVDASENHAYTDTQPDGNWL